MGAHTGALLLRMESTKATAVKQLYAFIHPKHTYTQPKQQTPNITRTCSPP
jgi:hypothetical protein